MRIVIHRPNLISMRSQWIAKWGIEDEGISSMTVVVTLCPAVLVQPRAPFPLDQDTVGSDL